MGATSPDVLMDPITGDLRDLNLLGRGEVITSQRLDCRLQTHRRDWLLDQTVGIDWETLLQNGTPADLAAEVAVEISNTSGVASIRDLDWSQEGDAAIITATAITTDGAELSVSASPPGLNGNCSNVVGGVFGHGTRVVP